MADVCERVAQGILLHGERLGPDGDMSKSQLLRKLGINSNTFRSAAEAIGAKERDPGLRFFDVSSKSELAFGPGAGLVVGVSIGTESLRAILVDANGIVHHSAECESLPGQLRQRPQVLLDRIAQAVSEVLAASFLDESLLVEGGLPLLGVSVAWPTAVDRKARPVGGALEHAGWRGSQSLSQLVGRHLGIESARSHALNDVNAAAIAFAFDETRATEYQWQEEPRLTLVLRLAGGIGGATIVIEPSRKDDDSGRVSGFLESTLIGGVDSLAGEIGHVHVPSNLIERLNADRPEGLGPLVEGECSCMRAGEEIPSHLESFISVTAVSKRIDPGGTVSSVLSLIASNPKEAKVARSLGDTGQLVGETLLGPIAWLNPATVVLTGSLGVQGVAKALDARVAESHPFVTHPNIRYLTGEKNDFIRARGAALAVHREQVFRRFPGLLSGYKKTLASRIQGLTTVVESAEDFVS